MDGHLHRIEQNRVDQKKKLVSRREVKLFSWIKSSIQINLMHHNNNHELVICSSHVCHQNDTVGRTDNVP